MQIVHSSTLMRTSYTCMVAPLHSLDVIGINTCSARSVSTRPEDFVVIDDSPRAKDSIRIQGVSGSGSKVRGRGAMVIKSRNLEWKFICTLNLKDPDFRVIGQEQWKKFGMRLVKHHDDHLKRCAGMQSVK